VARWGLSRRQTAVRSRALNAVADLRRGEARSLSEAARRRGTTVRSTRKYAPSAIRQPAGSRRWEARPSDSYGSTMKVLTVDGPRRMQIKGSRQRSTVGAHWAAVGHFEQTGDDSALQRFDGKSVRGRITEPGARDDGSWLEADLLTDTQDLMAMGARGELDDIDVYALSL
jgi:hypothetical protein